MMPIMSMMVSTVCPIGLARSPKYPPIAMRGRTIKKTATPPSISHPRKLSPTLFMFGLFLNLTYLIERKSPHVLLASFYSWNKTPSSQSSYLTMFNISCFQCLLRKT
jgi:hypothetical protein